MNELVLFLRTRAPQPLRSFYRAMRSFSPIQPSHHLPDELLTSCRFASSRLSLLNELPHDCRIAELGTDRGDFARAILERCSPKELHLIDLDLSRLNLQVAGDQRVIAHKAQTHEMIARFSDDYFDWVYVDADHSYRGTLRDARAAASKIRPGGFIVFNDFAHIDQNFGRYGVHRAVVDFALERQWPLAFFAFAPDALYDVALRKP